LFFCNRLHAKERMGRDPAGGIADCALGWRARTYQRSRRNSPPGGKPINPNLSVTFYRRQIMPAWGGVASSLAGAGSELNGGAA